MALGWGIYICVSNSSLVASTPTDLSTLHSTNYAKRQRLNHSDATKQMHTCIESLITCAGAAVAAVAASVAAAAALLLLLRTTPCTSTYPGTRYQVCTSWDKISGLSDMVRTLWDFDIFILIFQHIESIFTATENTSRPFRCFSGRERRKAER